MMERSSGLPYRYILGGASLIPVWMEDITEGGEISVDVALHPLDQLGEIMGELIDSGVDSNLTIQLTDALYNNEPFACSVILSVEAAEVRSEVEWRFRGEGRVVGIVPTHSIIFREEIPKQGAQTFRYEAFCVSEVSVFTQVAFIDTDISLEDAIRERPEP